MIPVLTKKEAFALDDITISSGYLSEEGLMENAGKSIAQFIAENINDPFNQIFNVIAGGGNNGGDGIIAHHYLLDYGLQSTLFLYKKDTSCQWIFNKYYIEEKSIQNYANNSEFNPDEWYVDAIFGIGLSRDVTGNYKEIIHKLAACPNIISIDIPSGIYSDTGASACSNVHASYTLTMGYANLGHFFNSGLESSGELNVMDIGLKPIEKDMETVQLIERLDICEKFPVNKITDHKYLRGKVLAVTSSKGYSGAGMLACDAALKSGAGIVKAVLPDSINSIFESNVIETITIPLEEYRSGKFSDENVEEILANIKWADALLFGPGLSNDIESAKWMADVLKSVKIPTVLDASGFLPLIENEIKIKDLPGKTILTPHYGEFSRLFNLDSANVQNNPIDNVKSIIPLLYGRVLVLKGPTTIIISENSQMYLMEHGLASLAVAGSGDVLSGIITALLAKGLSLNDAAVMGTYLHAECAHQFKTMVAAEGLSAYDLIQMIPHAMEALNDVY